jgi:hypothetical protein
MSERKNIPRVVKDRVLSEFNHRCAICGADRPQLHHIDENPANNDAQNIIPLCPNCHLIDQHNPTAPVDARKLLMFRLHKDPAILDSQFQPLFARLLFLDSITDDQEGEEIEARAKELVSFVSNLEMGSFYAKQIETLLKRRRHIYMWGLYEGPDQRTLAEMRKHTQEYRELVRDARDKVHALVVELLRYQAWK